MAQFAFEADWKVFRRIAPELRERFLEKENLRLLAMLQSNSQTPTERFWAAAEHSRKVEKILRRCLDGHSRSSMFLYMLQMYGDKMLTDEDLEGFSEVTRQRIMEFGAS